MKKIFFAVCLLVMVLGVGFVSSADLTEHDFNNFTMDVPSDASFKNIIPPGVNWKPSGSSVVADYNNSCWSDDDSELMVEFSNDDYKNVIKDRFDGAKLSDDKSDLPIYDISKCKYNDGHRYAVCKEIGNSVVILFGDDLDLLEEMASTAKI